MKAFDQAVFVQELHTGQLSLWVPSTDPRNPIDLDGKLKPWAREQGLARVAGFNEASPEIHRRWLSQPNRQEN